MWMFNGYGMGAGGWFLMALFWILLVALVVFAALRLFPSSAGGERHHREPQESPSEILRRRLASGEIDAATFDQLNSKLADSARDKR